MEKRLQLCRDLFQAVLSCQAGCQVPAGFNGSLLDALQRLMLELQQLQQEEQTRAVQQCLETCLQLLSRVSCLGPIEAFFTADDLLIHYQRHLDVTLKLTLKLYGQRQQRGMAVTACYSGAPAAHSNCSNYISSSCQLQLPQQQLRVVAAFRQQATQLCPRLVSSCSPEVMQQLCDMVKEGLVLVKGHSFLIGQEWQAEVTAMLGRADQLKVLLSHRQAHHLSLLAAVLQLLHRLEVQQFDMPQWQGSSSQQGQDLDSLELKQPQVMGLDRSASASAAGATVAEKAVGAGLQLGQQQARVMVAAGLQVIDEGLGQDKEDEFYMPVAPVPILSSTSSTPRASTAVNSPGLPFDLGGASTPSVDLLDDSLARMPSSGCSSLLEYVHNMPGMDDPFGFASQSGGLRSPGPHSAAHSSTGQQLLRRITEEQLQNIAGPEAVPVLAAALGVVLDCSEGSRGEMSWLSRNSDSSNHSMRSLTDLQDKQGPVPRPQSAVLEFSSSRSSSRNGDSPRGHGDQQLLGLEVASRQSSEPLLSRPAHSRNSSSLQPQQQRQRPVGGGSRHSSVAVEHSSCSHHPWSGSTSRCAQCTLCLQHTQLPAGCCKSIGAVLYISPHITRLVLIDVGIDDQAVGNLVDALRVNSSVVVLDVSQNRVEDVGARLLAGLLRQRSGSSSQLRSLYLQHNLIGDDGARALASGLSHNSTLQRLWLQHNSIGASGAQALAAVMQHNTQCTSLKLLPQRDDDVPNELGQMVQKLAHHNKGVRERIKGLLTHVLKKPVD